MSTGFVSRKTFNVPICSSTLQLPSMNTPNNWTLSSCLTWIVSAQFKFADGLRRLVETIAGCQLPPSTQSGYVVDSKDSGALRAEPITHGNFYNEQNVAAADDPRRRWAAFRDILHLTEAWQVQSNDENTRLSKGYAQFFV
jgi:hypothetical protein